MFVPLGELTITPDAGEAFNTTFILTASEWDGNELTYEYLY